MATPPAPFFKCFCVLLKLDVAATARRQEALGTLFICILGSENPYHFELLALECRDGSMTVGEHY